MLPQHPVVGLYQGEMQLIVGHLFKVPKMELLVLMPNFIVHCGQIDMTINYYV